MRLTVLGCYGPYPKAGGACSGYLLEHKNKRILIDCGNGVLSKYLIYFEDLNKLDAVFISHLHPDHMSDLMVLRYAIYVQKLLCKIKIPLPIYLPATPAEEYTRILYKDSFIPNIIKEDVEIQMGGLKIKFIKTRHSVECYGISFESRDKKFVYSADTGYFDGLINFAKESDLFLCEANFLHKDITETRLHLSGKQAGQIASKANVKKLILTHILPDNDVNEIFIEAEEVFTGELHIAREGKTFYI